MDEGDESDDGSNGGSDGGSDGSDKFDQRKVSIIRLGMLESSGFQKYSTLLVIQLFSRRLCLCHCLCIRLCLCICVPNSFLNSYYHKLSENVWVWGSGACRSGDVTMAGQPNKQGKIGLLSQWTMDGWDEQLSKAYCRRIPFHLFDVLLLFKNLNHTHPLRLNQPNNSIFMPRWEYPYNSNLSFSCNIFIL